jgi:hypothetical protein
MVKRICLLLAIVMIGACGGGKRVVVTHTVEPLRFIQPRASVALSGPAGVDIPVQLWVENDPENRQLDIVWRGAGCAGSSSRSLDAEYEAEVQPPTGPFNIRMAPGICTIVAQVLGPGGKVRWSKTFEMRICGGTDGCGEDKTK